MIAYQLVNEAIYNVLWNLKAALKMSIPLFVVVVLVAASLDYSTWILVLKSEQHSVEVSFAPGNFKFVVSFVFVLFATYWNIVSWHRFVILKDMQTSIFPPLRIELIWGYLWRLFLLTFCILLTFIIPMFVLFTWAFEYDLNAEIGDLSSQISQRVTLVNFIVTVVLTYAFLRYAPFLVAIAIGKPITAQNARECTYKGRWGIFLISIGYGVMSLLNSFIDTMLVGGVWQVGMAIELTISWLSFMFSISMMTTLYQAFVIAETMSTGGMNVVAVDS